MTRKIFIAGNWKMNKTQVEAEVLVRELKSVLEGIDDVEIAVAPTFTVIEKVAARLKDSNIHVAAQNVSWADNGAFTGEISADMLKEVGCSHVIIGHSERRTYFGETDEFVAKRVRKSLDSGLVPIMCIGETLEEREAGKTTDIVLGQVERGLKLVSKDEAATVVLAYEPVWAIGTGKTATPGEAQEVHAAIRAKLAEIFGNDVAEKMRIQYGGSVKASNAAELLGQKDIDGALVGGASLKAAEFKGIIDGARQ